MEKCYEKKICKESSLLRSGSCYGPRTCGAGSGQPGDGSRYKTYNQRSAAPDAKISYSVGDANPAYVSVKGNKLKVTRPYAGKGNYKFILTATVTNGSDTTKQSFDLTIAEGTSADTKAGYVYVCFGNVKGSDVQQLHFFLSEDGLNWTALNGFHPLFEVGTDYADDIETVGTHNYAVKAGTDIKSTTSGDASVLFPFEGNDQGVRDPYLIRGARKEDSGKVWILATDLNTMASKYGGNLSNNSVGNWGTMSTAGSTKLLCTGPVVWEQTDMQETDYIVTRQKISRPSDRPRCMRKKPSIRNGASLYHRMTDTAISTHPSYG